MTKQESHDFSREECQVKRTQAEIEAGRFSFFNPITDAIMLYVEGYDEDTLYVFDDQSILHDHPGEGPMLTYKNLSEFIKESVLIEALREEE